MPEGSAFRLRKQIGDSCIGKPLWFILVPKSKDFKEKDYYMARGIISKDDIAPFYIDPLSSDEVFGLYLSGQHFECSPDGDVRVANYDFKDGRKPSVAFVPNPQFELAVWINRQIFYLNPTLKSVRQFPKFIKSITFFNCIFPDAFFDVESEQFYPDENYMGAPFSVLERIQFENCTFGSFRIDNSATCPYLEFKSCIIDELGWFGFDVHSDPPYLVRRQLGFYSSDINKLEFRDTSFMRALKFSECTLGVAGKDGMVSFIHTKFMDKVSFHKTVFLSPPEFFFSEISQNVSFSGAVFLDSSSESATSAYRSLKRQMISVEADHEAQMFHALELEARYNTELPKGWRILSDPKGVETIASWFMHGLNNYGQHLWLPLVLLLYIGCWFLVLYAASGGVGYFPAEDKNIAGWVQNAGQHYSNVTFAARNFFGPFGLILSADEIQPNNMLVKTLGVAHFIISSVIWFIWILQIRSRFKL